MDLVAQLQRAIAPEVEEFRRLLQREFEGVGQRLQGWLASFHARMPYDGWRAEITELFATFEREQLMVDNASRAAFVEWLVKSAAAMESAAHSANANGIERITLAALPEDEQQMPPPTPAEQPSPKRADVPTQRPRGVDQYGSAEWFTKLVQIRESYILRAGTRAKVPQEVVQKHYDRRVKENSKSMYDVAWARVSQLLALGLAKDQDEGIWIAAHEVYERFYPRGDDFRPSDPETNKDILYYDYKARQFLDNKSFLERLAEDVLTPAGVNPEDANVDVIFGELGGIIFGKPGRSRSTPRPLPRPGKPKGKAGGEGNKARRPAPKAKPADLTRPQHGKPLHHYTGLAIAATWAADPKTVPGSVRYNQDLVDTHGNRVPGLRPDVQRLRRTFDGRLVVDVAEIISKSQKWEQLAAKKGKYQALLGDELGGYIIEDPERQP